MPFNPPGDILLPDPLFSALCILEPGVARRMTLVVHRRAIASSNLGNVVPDNVSAAFDRARNAIIYSFSTMICLSSANCRPLAHPNWH